MGVKMGEVLTNIVRDKKSVKDQLGKTPDVAPAFKRFNNNVQTKHVTTKVVKREYDGSNNVFILNNSTYGVLGQNKLGNNASTDYLHAVLPQNNIHYEYFRYDEFIDTVASTGTLDTSTESYTLAQGEVLQSEVIAKLRQPINTVRVQNNTAFEAETTGLILPFKLGSDTFSGDNVHILISNDSGATWYNINEGDIFTFPTSNNSDELKYKVEAINGSVTIDEPIVIQVNL